MKKIKNVMQKLSTKVYLTTSKFVAPLKNNNGSHLVEVIAVIGVVLLVIGLAVTSVTKMANNNLAAMSATMDGLFS